MWRADGIYRTLRVEHPSISMLKIGGVGYLGFEEVRTRAWSQHVDLKIQIFKAPYESLSERPRTLD